VKRWISLAVAVIFCAGLAAASYAASLDELQADKAKVQAYIKLLEKKKAAGKNVSSQLKGAKARLATINEQIAEAQPGPRMAPAPMAPAPVVRPAPMAPTYVASAPQYTIAGRAGYVGGGIGVTGTIAMPTILNEVVNALGLNQIGIGNAGLAVGGAYISGRNSAGTTLTYPVLLVDGILTLYAEPGYSVYAEGGLNFPVVVTDGTVGGQVAIGIDWAVPELGGTVFGEVGTGIFRRSTAGSTGFGVLVNAGYKFAF